VSTPKPIKRSLAKNPMKILPKHKTIKGINIIVVDSCAFDINVFEPLAGFKNVK